MVTIRLYLIATLLILFMCAVGSAQQVIPNYVNEKHPIEKLLITYHSSNSSDKINDSSQEYSYSDSGEVLESSICDELGLNKYKYKARFKNDLKVEEQIIHNESKSTTIKQLMYNDLKCPVQFNILSRESTNYKIECNNKLLVTLVASDDYLEQYEYNTESNYVKINEYKIYNNTK